MIYVFFAGRKNSHISLDNGKKASHNETIDLDELDRKRPLIKSLINASKNHSKRVDKLIKIEEPEQDDNNNS